MDALFEFLFKYRPVVFERGTFAFSAGWPVYVVAAAALAIAVPAILTYGRVRADSSPRDRAVLASLRIAALGVLLFCLFRPMVVLSAAVPQRNIIGILIDDSRSMRVTDEDGRPRSDFVGHAFGGPDSALYAELAERFMLRFFRFAGNGERVAQPSALTFDGARTHLGDALEGARQELTGVPLSALVVVSDGADNSQQSIAEPLLSLGARGIPVFTVGVGRERFTKDIEIARVETPRSVLAGASLAVDVMVVQRGFGGTKVTLIVEDGGRIVSQKAVTLAADGEAVPVRVRVPTGEAGPRSLTFRIAPQPGEMVAQNNSQQALVVVSDSKEKILYIEGEPRFELKFLRRAVEEDANLQIVTLQRTAANKFLRLSVDDSLELVTGFPKTREELFSYKGVVLGSIEASYFTLDQLRMLSDFVSVRGGGLLVLGGRRSFAEGGYAGTPLSDVLPVELDADEADSAYLAELKVDVSPAGLTHPATQIGASEDSSSARWKTLPAITTVNQIGRAKPGASVLLSGAVGESRQRQPVLLAQRYGRGKVMAFPVQDSWLWQMHADVPLEDMTHETFWRQLLRWLVSDVPGRVLATPSIDRPAPGEPIELRAEVVDPAFLKLNNADVTARVTAPSGQTTDLKLDWAVTRDGEYRAPFVPAEKGLHTVQVIARAVADTLTASAAYVQAADPTSEFFGAEMRSSLLKRIAQETGGRFYTPATVSALPKDIVFTESGNTVLEQKDLWDMPIIFLCLIGLVGAEWGYRRWKGLA